MPYLRVPQNSTVIINCAFEGIAEPYFEVDIGNTSFTDLEFEDSRGQREILRNHSLYEISGSPSAVIEINNTNVNNGTTIRCTYIGNSRLDQTTLLVYGLFAHNYLSCLLIIPTIENLYYSFLLEPTAIILDIVDVDISAVNISWSGLAAENQLNVAQNSTLTITHSSSWTIINTIEHHYSFTAPTGAPPCGVYNFSVTAAYVGATYTGAGCSVSSPVLSKMLPSLPDIERLNSTLTYFLVKIAGEVKLNVSFEVIHSQEPMSHLKR